MGTCCHSECWEALVGYFYHNIIQKTNTKKKKNVLFQLFFSVVLFQLKSEDLLLEPKGQYFKGYDPKTADGRIINSFATAVLRIGHTLVRDFFDLRTFSKTTRSSRILRAGRIPVKEFFNPALLLRGLKYNFIGAILLGLSQVDSQLLDP